MALMIQPSKSQLVISGLNSISTFLPEPASKAINVLAYLISVISLLLDSAEMKRENRELVKRLKGRAITLKEMVQEHALLVRKDSFLKHFCRTIESATDFVDEYNSRNGLQKVISSARFRASLKEHWTNLTELYIEFQTHLLCSIHSHGPHLLISDPVMSAFWKFQLQNPLRCRWDDFWDNFFYVFADRPGIQKIKNRKSKIEKLSRSKGQDSWVSPADIEFIFFEDGLCFHKSLAKIIAAVDAPRARIELSDIEAPEILDEVNKEDINKPPVISVTMVPNHNHVLDNFLDREIPAGKTTGLVANTCSPHPMHEERYHGAPSWQGIGSNQEGGTQFVLVLFLAWVCIMFVLYL